MTETSDGPLSWRPQLFGTKRPQTIRDPIVEPLWDGDRVLVHVDPTRIRIIDATGTPVEAMPEIEAALVDAVEAESIVLDGYLTPQAARTSEGAMLGEVTLPTAASMTSQLLLGRGGELRRNLADQGPPEVQAGDVLVLVCIDVLAIDDEVILDVPLLERRRILESAVHESDLIRVGVHVRAPIEPWLGSWRSQGFRAVAFKDPNGRYRPGTTVDGWASSPIPKR